MRWSFAAYPSVIRAHGAALRVIKLAGRVVVVLLLLVGLGVLAYPGYREGHYPNARGPRQEGQSSKIPPFIPDAAEDISLLTNLDTMESWGCFRLPVGRAEFKSRLAAEGAVRRPGEFLRKAERMFGRVPWWPGTMSQPGVDRHDLPSKLPGRVMMVGFSASDDQVCFYSGLSAG
jgi:hypothetical protein